MAATNLLISTSSGDGNIYSWDFQNETLLPRFKTNLSLRNGLCKLGAEYIVAAQAQKHSLHFWTLHREQVLQRCICSEALTVLAASFDGSYIAGGDSNGNILLWQSASGRLLKAWAAHFKGITALAFVGGASILMSGGEDTMVNTWVLPELLDPAIESSDHNRPTPLHAWADHTLPVTALLAGAGEATAVVASSSLDRTIKLRRLSDGCLLRSVVLPTAVNDLVMEPGELSLFAAGADGSIYEVGLVGNGDPPLEPAADASAIATPGLRGAEGNSAVFVGHSRAVTCLALATLDHRAGSRAAAASGGVVLLSGSEDGTVRVWDMRSRLPVQVIQVPGRGAVSSLLVLQLPGKAGGPTWDSAGTGPPAGVGRGSSGAMQRAQPLAPFSKFQGAVAGAQRWEGAPVIVQPATASGGDWGVSASMAVSGRAVLPAARDGMGLPAGLLPPCAGAFSAVAAVERAWELALGARLLEDVR